MSGLSLALSAASAYMQFRQGQAQAAMYEGQARAYEVQSQFTRFNAKQESLKHRKQAADEMETTLVRLAQINAAAGAGHMDPFSGNPFGLKIKFRKVGGTNYAFAKSNETITRLTGDAQANMQLYQAAQARQAGSAAKQRGVFGALFTLGIGAFNYAQTSIPGSTTPSLSTPGNFPTSFRYGTNFGSQQTSMLAQQDQGLYFLR
jgi:hypothetical protein|tara:strand:+ start:1659 stop:2270 length:612 start_codon:yes stop_codon:yes gene_type:complete